MKKLILAFVALAFAFAVSSCCDQSRCPGNMKCKESNQGNGFRQSRQGDEKPYRWDTQEDQQQNGQERPSRRW